MDLEKIATSAIVSSISKTDTLSSFINDGDKEPCWDGNIYIHEDSKHSKKNIKRIPTQVKGKAVKVKTIKDKITYPVSHDDLKAYMMDGGTLFFVVYIDKYSGDALQIYYADLLPLRIMEILKQKKKSYSVSFDKFPSDNKKKIEIVLDAYGNAQRQKSFAGQRLPTIDELTQQGILESLSFHFTHVGKGASPISPSKVPQIMEGKSLTVYANIKGNPIGIPVEYHQNIVQVMTSQDFDRVISVKDVIYYQQLRTIYSASDVKSIIGKVLTITSPVLVDGATKPVPVNMNIDIKGSLTEQIKGFEFVLAMAENDGFEIDGVHVPVSLRSNVFEEKIQSFSEKLSGLKYIRDLFLRMHVNKDLMLEDMSEEDEKNLNLLIGTIGKGKPVRNIPEDTVAVQLLNIANVSLGVVYVKHTDGYVYIHDYFNEHLEVYWKDSEVEMRISQFATMNAEDFMKYDNLYLPIILEDFKKMPISGDMINHANLLMLEMIKAYDQCKNEALLDAANQMNEWLKEYPDLIDQEICIINGCQIKLRKETLNYADKAKLFSIVEKTDNANYRAGAFILLGDIDEAERVFASFEEKQMKEFSTYPIYTLYQQTDKSD